MNGVGHSSGDAHWRIFGRNLPKSEIAFFCQIAVLYLVILTCIINLSIDNGDSNLWTALLSSSLGYILPNPSLKREKNKTTEHHRQPSP